MYLEEAKEVIENARDHVDEVISSHAAALRQVLIIPFCDKYKLSFRAGMGTYAFSDLETDVTVDSVSVVDGKFHPSNEDMKLVERLLETEVGSSPIFWAMTDYFPGSE